MKKPSTTITPRPYLSWRQYFMVLHSRKTYIKTYFRESRGFTTSRMRLGKYVAEELEKEKSSDEMIENIKLFIPHYKYREETITAPLKLSTGETITLLGIPDGFNNRPREIGEVKASKLWTQTKADESEQLTFYAYIKWLLTKKYYATYLHWLETTTGGAGAIKGTVRTFPTERTQIHFVKLHTQIEKAWKLIKEIADEEWSKVV